MQNDASSPVTRLLASSVLCLPIWSGMATPVASDICSAVERVYAYAPEVRAKLAEVGRGAVGVGGPAT